MSTSTSDISNSSSCDIHYRPEPPVRKRRIRSFLVNLELRRNDWALCVTQKEIRLSAQLACQQSIWMSGLLMCKCGRLFLSDITKQKKKNRKKRIVMIRDILHTVFCEWTEHWNMMTCVECGWAGLLNVVSKIAHHDREYILIGYEVKKQTQIFNMLVFVDCPPFMLTRECNLLTMQV